MTNVFDTFNILPYYDTGFMFSWTVSPSLTGTPPWEFQVQRAETPDGPWTSVSPPLEDKYQWHEEGRMVAPKDPVLYFRVTAVIGGVTYYSAIRQPYGDLSKREYLLVQNMQRHELLQLKGMSGVCGHVWSKAVFGPRCTACTDFVGGNPTDSNCNTCFGTGRVPGYHGPYSAWMSFSAAQRDKKLTNAKKGVQEDYKFSVRMLGTPQLKKDDIIVDTVSNKRYYVDVIRNIAEIRRVPVVQMIAANEIPVSSPLYRLGADERT